MVIELTDLGGVSSADNVADMDGPEFSTGPSDGGEQHLSFAGRIDALEIPRAVIAPPAGFFWVGFIEVVQ